jgi:prophage regulatory protein
MRLGALLEKYPVSKSTLYADIARGTFVPPISLGARSVGWIESEVDSIVWARAAKTDDARLQALVKTLVANRGTRKPEGLPTGVGRTA